MAIDPKLGGLAAGTSPAQVSSWLDLQGLRTLPERAAAGAGPGSGAQDEKTLRAVAQQFESLFLGMMLKSMRDAKLSDSPFDGEETRFYQDLFDKEISVQLAQGRGLGIADMLVRQLGGRDAAGAAGTPGAGAANAFPRGGAPALPVANAPGRDPAEIAAAATRLAAASQRAALQSFASVDAPREDRPAGGAPELPFSVGVLDPATFGAAVGASARRALDEAGALEPPVAGPFASSPADFVRKVLPHARAAGDALGVDPLGIVAQAALETGWGRSVPTSADGTGYNLFGIKAGGNWSGSRTVRDTFEFEDGVMTKRAEPFRAYESVEGSFADYVRLLGSSPRYADAVAAGRDPGAFARALQDAGYATDPDYARKIEAILRGDTLREALATLKDSAAGPK